MSYCSHGFGRCPRCDGEPQSNVADLAAIAGATFLAREAPPASSPADLTAQAIDVLLDVHAILVEAFGPDMSGSERGSRVSGYYLARIRDRMRGYTPERPPHICADCIDLRQRLVNIYHLTLTGHEPASTVRSVRAASGPGAPAPGVTLPPDRIAEIATRLIDVTAGIPASQLLAAMMRAGLIDRHEQFIGDRAGCASDGSPDLCEAEDA